MQTVFLNNHPVKNLKRSEYTLQPELIFGNTFSKYYLENFSTIHSRTHQNNCEIIREMAVHGLGISDMLCISWKGEIDNLKELVNSETDIKRLYTTRAFEFKISDWKRGLLQAHRYSFYSNASILVVPISTYLNALSGIDTFKKLNIGLWGFDIQKKTLRKGFTPRPNSDYLTKYANILHKKLKVITTEVQPIL